MSGIAHCYWAK